jgi:hypothetical protein
VLSVEVLVDGRPLPQIPANGATYVQAIASAEYSLRLQNHTPGRLAVALSVDGLGSIDARTTTAWRSTKWVLGPYESIVVDGWQVSTEAARHFYFTDERRSYAAWLGRTANIGVIEAVAFREQQPRLILRDRLQAPAKGDGAETRRAPAPGDTAKSGRQAEDYAATGIGRQVDNPVRQVHLRLERQPAAHLRIRYEYRQQLIQLGVLPPIGDKLERRERARGFEELELAPDPWAYDR